MLRLLLRINYQGRIRLSDGRIVRATLLGDCADAGRCLDGFCQGDGQCHFGDCHNPLPAEGAGTLCLECSAVAWKVVLPGQRASVVSGAVAA